MAPSRSQQGLIPLAAATSLLPAAVVIGWDPLRHGHGTEELAGLALALALLGIAIGSVVRVRTSEARNTIIAALEGSDDGFAIYECDDENDGRLVGCNAVYRRELAAAPKSEPGCARYAAVLDR